MNLDGNTFEHIEHEFADRLYVAEFDRLDELKIIGVLGTWIGVVIFISPSGRNRSARIDHDDWDGRQSGQLSEIFAATGCERSTAVDAERDVGADESCELEQLIIGQIEVEEAVEPSKDSGGVGTATGESCGDGDIFFQPNDETSV